MPAETELYLSSVFECKADIVVIPRSTEGTLSGPFFDRVKEWGLEENAKTSSEIGSVLYLGINEPHSSESRSSESRSRNRKSSIGAPFAGVAFATSVHQQTSHYAAIRQIGQQLGLLTKNRKGFTSIAAPVLGTGAGGLEPLLAYSVLTAAFLESATDDARLTIAVPDKEDFNTLYRMDGTSAKLALKASVHLIKDFFWCKEIADSESFYFDLAAKKLAAFKAFVPTGADPKKFYSEISDQVKGRRNFQEMLNLYPDSSEEYAFLLLTGKLIAHIDQHAYNKNLWNEYRDKRTLGKSGIRQNIWLSHLVQFKLAPNSTRISPSIINAFKFLEHPQHELSMMSDSHREFLMKNVFGAPYSGVLTGVSDFFDQFVQCKNERNRGALYTAILYSEQVIRIWLPQDAQNDDLLLSRLIISEEPSERPVIPPNVEQPPLDLPKERSQRTKGDDSPTPKANPVKSSFGLLSEITSNDLLDYKVYAHAIVKFIKDPSTTAPVTIGIFAPWGRGKTTLMKFIQKELEEYPRDPGPQEESTESPEEPDQSTSYEMLGGWIRDTSAALTSLPSLDNPVVWFNAWKFQKPEQVWSGFAYEIIRQLIEKLRPIDQERFWFFLNLKRVDKRKIKDKITFTLLNKLIKNSWYLVLLGVISVAFCFRIFYSGAIGGLPFLNWAGVSVGLGGALTLLKFRIRSLRATKLDFDLAKYVHAPDYKEQMGLFHSIEEDLKKALQLLVSAENPAVIIVDDLDRCSPKIVAEVIEAINLFISGDFPDCYFILGQDAQMVTASLDAAYKDIAGNTSYVHKNYGSLGWYFIEKFIQMPFTIPTISKRHSELLLLRWLGSIDGTAAEKDETIEKAKKELEEKIGQTSNNQEALIQLLPELYEITSKVSLHEPDEVIRLKNRFLDQAASTLMQDKEEIVNLIELYGNYMGNSPRTIKRFTNLYRFHRLMQFGGWNKSLIGIDTQAIARWVIIMIRWPQLVRCIQWETSELFFKGATPEERVREFEESFTNKTKFSEWRDNLHGTQPASWLDDSHLFEFMIKTHSENGTLSRAVAVGFW